MSEYSGNEIPKLGFGLMRLPKLKDAPGKIDAEQTKKMVDMFLDAGFYYFDTAYVYDGGDSERAIKEALTDRYPRDRYRLATKLCAWMGCSDEKSAKQEFYTSLERTGAGYFDYYLLHALQAENYQYYDKYHIWDFVRELREKGLVKNYGFSFHSSPELLDKLLTQHPEVDFVQLQINYADWDDPGVASRANYETARKHGKSIVVMEPVKGGTLASPPEAVRKLLKDAAPDLSVPSWAIRFAASLDGVMTVLSGMSDVEQMQDNISYMKDFKPLTAQEQDVIKKAQAAIKAIDTVPCTACRYCTGGCPEKISIPDIFSAMNRLTVYGNLNDARQEYSFATSGGGRASDCIACGQCERACPQQIKIIGELRKCVTMLERR